MTLRATTSQTVGPFFSIGLERLNCAELAGLGVAGERVTIEGRVLDADSVGVPDAIIELWQANSYGKYAHPDDPQDKPVEAAFRGYGRIPTDDDGKFRFYDYQARGRARAGWENCRRRTSRFLCSCAGCCGDW